MRVERHTFSTTVVNDHNEKEEIEENSTLRPHTQIKMSLAVNVTIAVK